MAELPKQIIDNAIPQTPIMSITGDKIDIEKKDDRIFSQDEDIFFLKGKIREFQNKLDNTGRYLLGSSSKNANGDTTITTGFPPKLIKITAHYAQDGAGFSQGSATSTTDETSFVFYYNGTKFIPEIITGYIIYVFNASGTLAIRATLSAVTATSFTLTFSNYVGSGTIYYKYEVFS